MWKELEADLARYPGNVLERWTTALRSAAFYPIVVYRLGHDIYFRWPRPARAFAKVPYKVAALLVEWATGISISPDADIGPGLYIGHWGCTRIGRQVKLGANCNLSPMVFIGFGARDGRTGVPEIGDRVYIATGAKIIGPIHVGSDVAIGANAVVCKDVPDHVTVGGVPAKVISRKGSEAYLQVGQELEVRPARNASPKEPPVRKVAQG
jgi:serine O-acetyltransferase